jgi:hypothetical protein
LLLCDSKTIIKQKKNIYDETLIDFSEECSQYASLCNLNGATNFMTWGDVHSFTQEQVPYEKRGPFWSDNTGASGVEEVALQAADTVAREAANIRAKIELPEVAAGVGVAIQAAPEAPAQPGVTRVPATFQHRTCNQIFLTNSRVMVDANLHSSVLNTNVTLRFVYDVISKANCLFC